MEPRSQKAKDLVYKSIWDEILISKLGWQFQTFKEFTNSSCRIIPVYRWDYVSTHCPRRVIQVILYFRSVNNAQLHATPMLIINISIKPHQKKLIWQNGYFQYSHRDSWLHSLKFNKEHSGVGTQGWACREVAAAPHPHYWRAGVDKDCYQPPRNLMWSCHSGRQDIKIAANPAGRISALSYLSGTASSAGDSHPKFNT